MIPFMIVALVLLAAAVVYQQYRLQQLAGKIEATNKSNDDKKAIAVCDHNMPLAGMPSEDAAKARHLVELLFPVHAWHGISPGESAPDKVNAVIEIVPEDRVKFELDKPTGMLLLDRPQLLVNGTPVMYGFIPRTLCAELVGKHCEEHATNHTLNLQGIQGDGDPIDICVLTEKDVSHGNILVRARPIGGLRMIDKDSKGVFKADDKIIAVLEGDVVYGDIKDIKDLKPQEVDRLKNYFLTYKQLPSATPNVEITDVYGPEEAKDIIGLSAQDYRNHYGNPESRFEQLVKLLFAHWSQTAGGGKS